MLILTNIGKQNSKQKKLHIPEKETAPSGFPAPYTQVYNDTDNQQEQLPELINATTSVPGLPGRGCYNPPPRPPSRDLTSPSTSASS